MAREVSSLRRSAVLIGLLAVGFVFGQFLKHKAATSVPARLQDLPTTRHSPHAPSSTVNNGEAVPLDLRSTDTLEDLINLSPQDLYEPLALWLVDATSEDMATFWSTIQSAEGIPTNVLDLFFIRWTLNDPFGAIQAAAGTPHCHIPWWAWAKNDPGTAFQHALAHDRLRLDIIMRAIGQSDPKLAQKLLTQYPDLPPGLGFDGILHGLTRDDPEAATKLARENNRYLDTKPFEAWIKDDPQSAFNWFLANRQVENDHSNADSALIKSLIREHPELLTEFASKLPSGALRRKFEAAAFDQLLLKDPEKALDQARKNPSTLLATERLTKIALRTFNTDPAKAKSLFAEILTTRPDFFRQEFHTHYPNGRTFVSSHTPESEQLITQLVRTDPVGTMNQLITSHPDATWNATSRHAAETWIRSEPENFAHWAERLQTQSLKNDAFNHLINTLRNHHNYEAAISYTANLNSPDRDRQLGWILKEWHRADPGAAADWEQANGH
jgi:hypothetical protein